MDLPSVVAGISGIGVIHLLPNGRQETLYDSEGERIYGVEFDDGGNLYVAHHDMVVRVTLTDKKIVYLNPSAAIHSLSYDRGILYAADAANDCVYMIETRAPFKCRSLDLDQFFTRPDSYTWGKESANDWCHMNYASGRDPMMLSLFRHPERFWHGTEGGAIFVLSHVDAVSLTIDGSLGYDLDRPHCIVKYKNGYLVSNTGKCKVDYLTNVRELLYGSANPVKINYKTIKQYVSKNSSNEIKYNPGPHHIEVWEDDTFAVAVPNLGEIHLLDGNGVLLHKWDIPGWSKIDGEDPRCFQFKLL